MERRISNKPKRISYVPENFKISSKGVDCSSAGDDSDEIFATKKVRRGLSILELKKNSECFQLGEDHIYSKLKHKDSRNSLAEKYNMEPRMITRRQNSHKSQCEEVDNNTKNSNLFTQVKRQKCFSKNAVLARLNRERKKQYISSLESTKESLEKQNYEMQQNVYKQEKVIAALQYEVKYLKCLLSNSKEISEILRSLKNSTGLPVTSSLHSCTGNSNDEFLPENIDGYGIFGNVEKSCDVKRQPNVKSISSGVNFPILQQDVNLGSFCSPDNEDFLMREVHEESDLSFSAESDHSSNNFFSNEDNLDFGTSQFDLTIDKTFGDLGDTITKSEFISEDSFQNSDEIQLEAGICLHVNKQKISVELCSKCNKKAQVI